MTYLDEPHVSLPGQRLQRGVLRHLASLGMAGIAEFTPERGLRVDVMALTPKGEVWVIECKSSLADYRADAKWQGYLPWCDRFFWAVPPEFPQAVLPAETGLLRADDFGAEVVRDAPLTALATVRRRALILRMGMVAARRLQALRDPGAGLSDW
jgi:hypothetical protein